VRDDVMARGPRISWPKGSLAVRRIISQPDLLATLRRGELDAVGARLSAKTGPPDTPVADATSPLLVPTASAWSHLGGHGAGVAKESAGIEWIFGHFGHKRGLEI
jgi:hypothetical protein